MKICPHCGRSLQDAAAFCAFCGAKQPLPAPEPPTPPETVVCPACGAEQAPDALRGSAKEKRVRISVSGEPVSVSGVRTFLYEMVYNLCDNAVKYNVEDGEVELSVSGTELGAVLSVRDTGTGIPPEYQDRVFERFFRVDKSRSKASGGTGLGLSIVKHIVQYHRGAVSLESGVGKGTTISVALPQYGPEAPAGRTLSQ